MITEIARRMTINQLMIWQNRVISCAWLVMGACAAVAGADPFVAAPCANATETPAPKNARVAKMEVVTKTFFMMFIVVLETFRPFTCCLVSHISLKKTIFPYRMLLSNVVIPPATRAIPNPIAA
jgi:hypothetical protein